MYVGFFYLLVVQMMWSGEFMQARDKPDRNRFFPSRQC